LRSEGRRPYDLRHACLSTWLNGGVAPTQVAEWAGHGVDVLLRIYATRLAGQDEIARRRIIEALGEGTEARPAERKSQPDSDVDRKDEGDNRQHPGDRA
jgi:hypothetical protein